MPATPRIVRLVALCVLVTLIMIAIVILSSTETGRHLMREPHRLGNEARHWVSTHSIAAPLILILVFIVSTILMLPVWWLQILAGFGFGLLAGVIWCQIGATLGAVCAVATSRWIASDWIRARLHGRLGKLNEIDEKLGHNGLLVVMAVRLVHLLPFAVSSYVIGLTRISLIDVIVGNLLGGIPITTLYVTIGADHARLTHWEFVATIVGINVILLIPLAVRYLKPEWFRKVGIE